MKEEVSELRNGGIVHVRLWGGECDVSKVGGDGVSVKSKVS